jgi:hypothetical protein
VSNDNHHQGVSPLAIALAPQPDEPSITMARARADRAKTPELAAQGARIREAIDAKGLSYKEAAEALGVVQHGLDRWMAGANSAKHRFVDLELLTGRPAAWFERGDGPVVATGAQIVETFIHETGPTLKPPLSSAEAAWLRRWPHHRITRAKLLGVVDEARLGIAPEDIGPSEEATAKARAKGDALGVKRRAAR